MIHVPTLLAELRAALRRNDADAARRLLDALEQLVPAGELAALLERLLDEEPETRDLVQPRYVL